jgi:integrase
MDEQDKRTDKSASVAVSKKARNPIHKQANGRYTVTFRDQARKLTRKTFDKHSDAQKFLDETRTAVRNGTYIVPNKTPTVKEAAEDWIQNKKVTASIRGGERKQSTIDSWQYQLDRFIIPDLGGLKITNLSRGLLEKTRDKWAATGIAPQSVNKILVTLYSICERQKGETIHFNPVDAVDKLARVKENETDRDGDEVRESDVYNPDEIRKLLSAAREGFDKTILEVFLSTGVRHGECLALKWEDMDFDKKEVIVRRNWEGQFVKNPNTANELYFPDQMPVFTTPKTRSSIRRIPISDELILTLKKWKLKSPKSPWDLVFPRDDGQPYSRKRAWEALEAATKASKVEKRLKIHDLRHTFISLHLMMGTPIPEVTAMAGHSSPMITMSIYGHFIPKMRTAAAENLAALLHGKKEVKKAGEE